MTVRRTPKGIEHPPARQRDMSAPLQEWPVQIGRPDAGRRLDTVLAERLPFRSRSQLQALIRRGRVASWPGWSRSGKCSEETRPARRLHAGELLVVSLDAPFVEEGLGVAELDPDLVLLDDAHLLAVDKPSGWSVHPSPRHRGGSLLERIHRWQRGRGDEHLAAPCHRLDRDTSGVMLLVRTAQARRRVGDLLQEVGSNPRPRSAGRARDLSKTYLAVVSQRARDAPAETVVRRSIARDPDSDVAIRRRALPPHSTGGSDAVTLWRTLERHGDRALVALEPLTGRPHQLRVHAAAIACPILGDGLYLGGDDVFLRRLERRSTPEDRELLGSERLALHAHRLALPHPAHGRPLEIVAPLPEELGRLCRGGHLPGA